MSYLPRLLSCVLLAALPVAACGDDGSSTTRGGAGQAGEDAGAGESNNDAAGSHGGGTRNTGGTTNGSSGDGGEGPEPTAGSTGTLGGADGGGAEGGAGGGQGGADPGGDRGGAAQGGAGGATTCELGEAASAATNQELNLFGTIVYFDDGAELPAGRYRVTYLDGCMKYASSQDWTIHAYADGVVAAWWLVGADSSERIVVPPGTIGYSSSNGAYTTFDECIAANAALAPVEFDFEGGKLGVWLLDNNYGDNLAGESGRNPKWKLTLLGDCAE